MNAPEEENIVHLLGTRSLGRGLQRKTGEALVEVGALAKYGLISISIGRM